jgi:hypothetical protein
MSLLEMLGELLYCPSRTLQNYTHVGVEALEKAVAALPEI